MVSFWHSRQDLRYWNGGTALDKEIFTKYPKMMMPVFPGAPWVPKFIGIGSELKYGDWKEQMQGLLEAQEVPEAKKVKILMGALGGDAKREIGFLADGDRDKANKIFEHLDTRYAGEIPLPVLRSHFSVVDRDKMSPSRRLCLATRTALLVVASWSVASWFPDYRKLNTVTHKDAFPLPRIEETLTTLKRAEWFSTLDLASGYWQVGVHPEDRPKAFAMPLGLYEFQCMPFGLCNTPATFQRSGQW